MNLNNKPIYDLYYLIEADIITETDYYRIADKLNHIVASLKQGNDQQEIEKLMNNILDEETSLFLKNQHFRELLKVTFRTIIYQNSADTIHPNIVEAIFKNWFETSLSPRERILFLQENVFDFEEQEINLKIKYDFDKVLSQDFDPKEFTDLATDTLSYFDQFEIFKSNGNMDLLVYLPRIYAELGKILGYNMDSFLLLWYNKHAKRKPKPIAKLKTAFNSRIKIIQKHELMDRGVLVQLVEKKETLFKEIEENHLETAIETVERVIQLLKTTALETAEKEFFADFYMEIGIHLNYDFTEQLKSFLYSANTNKYLIKKELPWK